MANYITLNDLSDDDLDHLDNAMKTQQFDQKAEGLLRQLDDKSLTDLESNYNAPQQQDASEPKGLDAWNKSEDVQSARAFGQGIVKGALDFGGKADQLLLNVGEKLGLVDKNRAADLRQGFKSLESEQAPMENTNPFASKAGQFVGANAIPIMAGGAAGSGIKAAAALGATQGAILNPDQPVQGAILGGAVGGGAQAGLNALGGVASKYLGGLTNKIDDAAQAGVAKPTQSMLDPNSFAANVEHFLSNVPFIGTKGARANAFTQADTAIKNLSTQALKEAGINGGSIDDAVHTSLKGSYEGASKRASSLFQQVDQAAGDFDLTSTKAALGAMSQGSKYFKSSVDPKLAQFASLPDQVPIGIIHEARQRVDDLLSEKIAQGLSSEIKPLRSLREALTKDYEAAAVKAGVGDVFKEANSLYANKIIPMNDLGIKDVINDRGTATSVLNKFMPIDKPNPVKAADFLNSFDKEGRKIAEAGALQNILNRSTGKDGALSIDTALQRITNFTDSYGSIISGQTKDYANGVRRVLGYIKNGKMEKMAQQIAKPATMTGNILMGGAAAGLSYVNAPLAASLGVASKLTSLMVRPEALKNIARIGSMSVKGTAIDNAIMGLFKTLAVDQTAAQPEQEYQDKGPTAVSGVRG
jgi:hypothetical protein